MNWIDSYAYANRLRFLNPLQKMALAVLGIGLCLVLNHPIVGCLTALWMAALLMFWAKIPPRAVFKVITAESLFLLVMGVNIFFSVEWGVRVQGARCMGSLCVFVAPESPHLLLLFLSRALGCLVSLNFLALTTPMPDFLEALRKLHVSPLLLDLMMIIYRQIFILLETIEKITTAQISRLGYANLRVAFHSTANLVVNLFIETIERSECSQRALESRGFSGQFKVLTPEYTSSRMIFVQMAGFLFFVPGSWWLFVH
jgi:cobalt/nickel transport system permease protein